MHDGIDGEGGNALEAELVHDIAAVRNNRCKADVETVGYLFVDVALHDERHDFDLAVREDFALQHLRHGRHMLAMTVAVLLEGKQ